MSFASSPGPRLFTASISRFVSDVFASAVAIRLRVPGKLAVQRAAEGAVEELGDQRAGDAVLLRKTVDRGSLLQVAGLLQPLGQERVEPPLEVAEFLLEALAQSPCLLGRIERRAPDLRAL